MVTKTMDDAAQNKQQIGLLFGSYNPPTLGHLGCALNARKQLGLSEIWLVPIPHSPLKIHIDQASIQDKLTMCRLLARPHRDWLKVSAALKDAANGFSGTLRSSLSAGFNLQAQHPDKDFYLIGGSDNDLKLRLYAMNMAIACMAAPLLQGNQNEAKIFQLSLLQKITNALTQSREHWNKFQVKTFDRQDGSSTEVRQLLQQQNDRALSACLSPEVQSYISRKQLYRPRQP